MGLASRGSTVLRNGAQVRCGVEVSDVDKKAAEMIRQDERERCIRCALYLAWEWRDPANYGGTITDEGKALRERSAEAAELVARRLGWDGNGDGGRDGD